MIKNKDEKEFLNDEDHENESINFYDIVPNHYIGRNNN